MNPPADTVERATIRTCLDETLLVEAAAGTGKTTELVHRIVNLLSEGRAAVDGLVAVTFTEKAAGELKLRLRSELERARGAKEADPVRSRNLETALEHLEEAHVSTIHGFCAELLSERPVESGIDPRFTTLNESQAKVLYRRAFNSWLQQNLESPPEGLRRSLRRRSLKSEEDEGPVVRLEKAGWELVSWRDFPAPWNREPFARDGRIDELIEQLHAFAAILETCANPKRDGFYQDVESAWRTSESVRSSEAVRPRDYDELEGRLAALASDWKFCSPGRKGYDWNWRSVRLPEVKNAHASLVERLTEFVQAADADMAALLHSELLRSIALYEELKRQAGALDFVDLLVRARDLIRDHDNVRHEFQRRFTRILVDEFQDTDPLQAEILLLLSADDPAERNWRKVRPAAGKLFAVGDPKQSIYRFRRADVGIYHEVKELLAARGARNLRLTTSFRALPPIQRMVNNAFAPVMTGDRRTLQAEYIPLVPSRDDVPGQPSIVVLPVPEPYGRNRKVALSAVERSLPDGVGAFVQWLVEDSGWTVSERAAGVPERRVPLRPRHIALLFRRFEKYGTGDLTRPYVQALEARGIPHLLVGGRSFHQREEIETLRAALAAIEWPDDELSVFATLRGPLFAVSDAVLLEWRHRFGRLHPHRTPDEGVPEHLAPIREALDILRELHRRRNYVPAAETLSRLLGETRAHAAFALRPSGEQALANVLHVAELARRYENSGGISFRGFIEHLEEQASAGETGEAPILEEGSDGVRLMTVHKAKGLEFPVVILADITAPAAPRRASRFVDAERRLCAVRLAQWLPAELLENEQLEIQREQSEMIRLAYVGATRARDLLVVPAVGDEPLEERWLGVLNPAIYPGMDRRRISEPHPGCPAFGDDSVLIRPEGEPAWQATVRPGSHVFEAGTPGEYRVVWWDPRTFKTGVTPGFGLRQRDLISREVPAAVVQSDLRTYQDWEKAHNDAIARGSRPSLAIRIPTTMDSAADAEDEAAVDLVRLPRGAERPGGVRFGTLVHAVLAAVPLDGDGSAVTQAARLQSRILGATPEETAAAARVVNEALRHPLLDRARQASALGRCRRETPVTLAAGDGSLVEGVLDLAFEEASGWTVVDFKTDREMEKAIGLYRRQVLRYAEMVSRATGKPAKAVLMQL
jgi:ATP-dependent exoDNAse (exonuclease V) beta subunit